MVKMLMKKCKMVPQMGIYHNNSFHRKLDMDSLKDIREKALFNFIFSLKIHEINLSSLTLK